MTNEQLTVALERARQLGGARFTNIGDISCDLEVCSDLTRILQINEHILSRGALSL